MKKESDLLGKVRKTAKIYLYERRRKGIHEAVEDVNVFRVVNLKIKA